MERKRKVRRFFILSACIYVIINVFVYGLMKAYMNSNNIVSRQKVVMASVNENAGKTEIEILGKKFSLEKNKEFSTVINALIYSFMPDNARTCTEIVLDIFMKSDII